MAIKVYLSPSNQDGNTYAVGNTNEMVQCNRIAEATEVALKRCGFAVKRAPQGQSMSTSISESNAWGSDLHIPIHTNAGGGNGTLVMVYSKSESILKYANPIYEEVQAVSPGTIDYGVQARTDLAELNSVNAVSVYIEVDFHDDATIAQWLIDNPTVVAEAIAKGVCTGAGVSYIPPSGTRTGNEYDSQGRIILRDTAGTIISMFQFFHYVLGAGSYVGNPPEYHGGYTGHKGYDFPAPSGAEIRSTCWGTVAAVYSANSGPGASMGNSVCIEEIGQPGGATKRYHRYMHMVSLPVVREGDKVQQGTLLGYVGTTGNSDGNHLHYDITSSSCFGTVLDAWKQFHPLDGYLDWSPSQIVLSGDCADWSSIPDIKDGIGIDYGPYMGQAVGPSITVDLILIPPKRIMWDPEPGSILKQGSVIRVATDAVGATIYFTSDGSTPTTESQKCTSGIVFSEDYYRRNWFFRARAFDSAGNVVAQGSACYTREWDRPKNDPANGFDIPLEINRRPYLQYSKSEDSKSNY